MINLFFLPAASWAHAIVRFFRWALNAILFVTVAAISAYVVYTYTKTNVHPRTVKAIWAEETEVRAGGNLFIMVLVDIHAEICRGEVHRWIIRSEDNTPAWYAIEPAKDVELGRGLTIRIAVPIPEGLAPGGYYYKSIVYDRRCDDVNRAFPPTTPAFVYFRVVA